MATTEAAVHSSGPSASSSASTSSADYMASNSSQQAWRVAQQQQQRKLLSSFHSPGSPRRAYSLGPDTAGCGTFGVVRIVTERKTGRRFACKMVHCRADRSSVEQTLNCEDDDSNAKNNSKMKGRRLFSSGRTTNKQHRRKWLRMESSNFEYDSTALLDQPPHCPPPTMMVESSTAEEVFRELYALAALSGTPGVAQLKEFFWHGNTVYIVMFLLDGGNLLSLTSERGSYTEDDARAILQTTLQSVDHIHSKGFVHRDLKLENLVLAEPHDLSSVTILDFGLSHRMTNQNARELTECCGSPEYVSPEVIAQSVHQHTTAGKQQQVVPGYGKECDVWALGVVLYILLSGYPPFSAPTVGDCLKRVYAGDLNFDDPVWELVSFEAKDLICSLLTVDPSDRATVSEALAHPWFRMST